MKSYNFLVKMLIYGRNKDYFTLLYLVSGWTVSLLSYTTGDPGQRWVPPLHQL